MINNNMVLCLNVEDPEGTAPVLNAHCVLAEVHLNYESQAVIGVFKCWRSREAFDANRKIFNTIHVVLPPKEGGTDFLAQPDTAKAAATIGTDLISFSLATGKLSTPNSNPDLKPSNG